MKDRRGFTLIEILVVIAMIMALIAIAFPVLGAAKARARRVQCSATLKQVGTLSLLHYDMYSTHPSVLDYGYYAERDGLDFCPDAPAGVDTYAENWNPWPVERRDLSTVQPAMVSGGFVISEEPLGRVYSEAEIIRTFCPHKGGWVVLWCDGHVTYEKQDPTTLEGWDPEAYQDEGEEYEGDDEEE